MPEPPRLDPLDVEEKLLYSKPHSEPLLNERASHLISKCEPGQPVKKAHFVRNKNNLVKK